MGKIKRKSRKRKGQNVRKRTGKKRAGKKGKYQTGKGFRDFIDGAIKEYQLLKKNKKI